MADHRRLLHALAIGFSSVLLFSIQPMIAKVLLPSFGGSAGLFVTCMLFFQAVLLLGYLYAYLLTRHASRRLQAQVHVGVLVLSVAALPWRSAVGGTPPGYGSPVVSILAQLAMSIGLPYFLLSANSPLLQAWFAASPGARFPYRLFAWSNLASLAALLAYPAAVERLLPLAAQLRWWSGAFVVLAVLLTLLAVSGGQPVKVALRPVERGRALLWVGLAACASALWLAVVNHLNAEVAAIPLLWVLPLSVYLLSFILCFEFEGAYRPAIYRWLLPAAWIAVGYRLARGGSGGLLWEIPMFLAALFVCSMFCHGELARTKPEPEGGLPFFYLAAAFGGVLGGVFVALVAPYAFHRPLELPIAVTACVLLALAQLYRFSRGRLVRLGVVSVLAFLAATSYRAGGSEILRSRNFYGSLLVTDAGAGVAAVRSLYHGSTLHGVEFLDPSRSRSPTAFYGGESGAGLLLEALRAPRRRVGIVGLGVGTLAAYGRQGDVFRIFEIDPAVAEVAGRYFRFLSESAATTEVVIADGRLGLAHEPDGSFDAIILDAFSDDTVPVHLLTREAFQLYFRRLRAGGSLAVHVTNRYLDLVPVVRAGAEAVHAQTLLIRNSGDAERRILPADWVVVTNDREVLDALRPAAEPAGRTSRTLRWTDDYSGIFSLLR